MGFSRQEYWRGLPFPSPGDLPDPGIEPRSAALQADSLPSEPPGKTKWNSQKEKDTSIWSYLQVESKTKQTTKTQSWRLSEIWDGVWMKWAKRIKKTPKGGGGSWGKAILLLVANSDNLGTSLVVQWLRLWAPSEGDLGLIPGQRTGSHTLQLRVCVLQLKILRATVKTQRSQINQSINKMPFLKAIVKVPFFLKFIVSLRENILTTKCVYFHWFHFKTHKFHIYLLVKKKRTVKGLFLIFLHNI